MNTMDRELARLTPAVRQACASEPAAGILQVLHAAAQRQVRRRRAVRLMGLAAAAGVAFSCAGLFGLQAAHRAAVARQARLMDDMLFLCDDERRPEIAPGCTPRENAAHRLLLLQGLDSTVMPAAADAAEPPAPPSTDSQSGSTSGLRARRCG